MKSPVSLNVVLAVAGLGLMSRPASAQTPAPTPPEQPPATFEIYGTLVPFFEYARTTGATAAGTTGGASQSPAPSGTNAPGRFVMDPSTSNLGFRGGVDLMKGLAVVWQIESGVPVDGTAAANTIASRNTNIGLTGTWGTLFFGNWDTPYKWNSNQFTNPIRAGFLPDYNGIIHGPGFGVNPVTTQVSRANALADAAFYRRVGNSAQYWSPNLSGLNFRLMYGANEGRTTRTAMVPSYQPTIFSANIGYDTGPVRLRYAYELHKDYFGLAQMGGSQPSNTNRSSLDQGHEVLAQFTNPAPGFETRVVGIFEFLSYSSKDTSPMPAMGNTPAKEYSRAAVYGLIDQAFMGKHHLWATFGVAFDGSCKLSTSADCSTKGLGANMATLGYIYRASRNTDLFAAAYRITNSASGQYSSPGAGGTAAPGADTEAFGIGIVHQFSVKLGGPVKATAPPAQPSQPEIRPTPPPGEPNPNPNPPNPAPTPPNR
jgi:predicted porin